MSLLEDIKKYKLEDWYVEHMPASLIILSGVARAFTYKLTPENYSIIICYFENGEVDWLSLISDQNNVGELIFEKHKKDRNYWIKHLNNYLAIRGEIEDNFRRIKDENLSNLSDGKILKEIKRYIDLQLKERRISSCADAFIFYSGKKLKDALNHFRDENPGVDINEAIEVLARPESPSFLNEAELELIGIAKGLKEGKDIREMILKHIDKYCWIKSSFVGGKEYLFEDAHKEAEEIALKDIDEELRKNNLWRNNSKIKEDYILKYKFNEEILSVAELSSVFSELQDIRKESSLISMYLHTKFLKEISKRKGANLENLLMMSDFSEVEDFVRGKLSEEDLEKRRERCLIVFKKNRFEVFNTEEAFSLVKEIINHGNQNIQDVREFTGTAASSGIAEGRVRIVITEKDSLRFQKGEILVSTMTRPEHIAAMKKAVAVVTNEGGITCHAAIVSREFGIPCIIGTKIATKVLRDGDLVKVDANNGIIKVIKK